MRQHEQLNRIQDQAASQAIDQLDRLWPSLEPMDPAEARDTLLEATPALVDQWGSVAGSASADWYEEAREAALGEPGEALLAEVDREAIEGSVRWAARDLYTPGLEHRAKARLGDAIDRNVRNMGRQTIAKSIDADRANVRWARMMSGTETCPWCRMLASRGFVYRSRESAGGGDHAWGHDNCRCQVVPDFALSEADHDQYEAERMALYDQYQWVTDERLQVQDARNIDADAVAREWRRNIIDYDEALLQLSKIRNGSSSDSTIETAAWDDTRRQLVSQLEVDYPDGFAYGRRLMPRNPSQVPADWGADAEDMPAMDAETWNGLLYGHDGSGGHMAGYGWANSEDPVELPEDWDQDRVAQELQQTITDGDLEDADDGAVYHRSVEGRSISIDVGATEDGVRYVRDVLIA